MRREAWVPEVPLNEPSTSEDELPESELRRISEEFEISVDKLESLLDEIRKIKKN